MTSTESLFEVAQLLRLRHTLRHALRTELRELSQTPAYLEWAQGLEQASPFVPPEPSRWPTLLSTGLLTHCLTMKVLNHHGRVFLTDGVWVDPAWRVFPFGDETAHLQALCDELGWDSPRQAVVDLAAGCGQGGLLKRTREITLLDINPRAVALCALNSLLAYEPLSGYAEHTLCAVNDLRLGLAPQLQRLHDSDVLVLANVPFGPAPRPGALALTSDGGRDGLSLQEGVFKALVQLRQNLRPEHRVRALVMGITTGSSQTGVWALENLARKGLAPVAAEHGLRLHWHMLHSAGLLRINGKRALTNPASTATALLSIPSCRLYHPNPGRAHALLSQYEGLAHDLVAQGEDLLAYGVLSVEMGGGA